MCFRFCKCIFDMVYGVGVEIVLLGFVVVCQVLEELVVLWVLMFEEVVVLVLEVIFFDKVDFVGLVEFLCDVLVVIEYEIVIFGQEGEVFDFEQEQKWCLVCCGWLEGQCDWLQEQLVVVELEFEQKCQGF